MSKVTKRRTHTNSLSFEHRVKLLDWVRSFSPEELREKRLDEDKLLLEAHNVAGTPCNIQQLKSIALAGGVEWPLLSGKSLTPDGARLQKLEWALQELQDRVTQLEEQITSPGAAQGASDDDLPD